MNDFQLFNKLPKAKKQEQLLLIGHQMEASEKNAEFYNFGWAIGEDFIHSKTSKGRLYSEIDKDGNVTHEWQKLKTCVLCGAQFYGFGNNPAPLTEKGQCCDTCNDTKVIPARMAGLRG